MSQPSFFILPPNRVWRTYLGGRTLDRLQGEAEPIDSHFPEDWLASTTRAVNVGREDHPDEGLAYVEHNGQNVTLASLVEADPASMLGSEHVATHGSTLGFLAKLLDSSIRLHIQAHPTVAFSRQHLKSNHGKTEGYYIVSTRPEVAEPYIYFGFQRPPDRAAYRRAILEQDTDALLAPFDPVPVQPGDCFVVPGGVPHAIGEGVFMVEIMEPTDFTVRLEFERGGYVLPDSARFMGRDVDFALDMLDFSPWPIDRIRNERFGHPQPVACADAGATEESLIDRRLTDLFEVRRLRFTESMTRTSTRFYVGIVVQGAIRLTDEHGVRTPTLRTGQSFFIPRRSGPIAYESLGHEEAVVLVTQATS